MRVNEGKRIRERKGGNRRRGHRKEKHRKKRQKERKVEAGRKGEREEV